MKRTIIFYGSLLLVFLLGSPVLSAQSTASLKERFKDFMKEGESFEAATYGYLIVVDKNGHRIRRDFYFEPLTMVGEYYLNEESERDGAASFWSENGHLKKKGFYKNAERDGIWQYYHRKTHKLNIKGAFLNAEREGVWETYHKNGWLMRKETYKRGKLEGPFIKYDSLGVIVNEGTYHADTIFQQTKEEPPKVITRAYLVNCSYLPDDQSRFNRSVDSLIRFVYRHVEYPEVAIDNNLEGKTYTRFMISPTGEMEEIDIVRAHNSYFKEELLKLFSQIKDWKWQPATENGKPVRTSFILPVKFQLE